VIDTADTGQESRHAAASVVVTTFKRPDRLGACLDGLRLQAIAPAEVIAVVHESDEESARLVEGVALRWPALRCVRASRRGLVSAYNCGLAAVREPMVAFIDDDAVPSEHWLAGIVKTFSEDERIAAVGGRDVIFVNGQVRPPRQGIDLRGLLGPPHVGRIQWFGRMLGNHHTGVGPARDVDILKGVNMAFRTAAILPLGFDERLRGRGVEIHSELSICLPLRRRGLRVVYDPEIVVTHHPAPRRYGDPRDASDQAAVSAASHNEALALLDHFGPLRRLVFSVWAVGIGATHAPGFGILLRDLVARRPDAVRRFAGTQRGRAAAWRTHRTARQVPVALRSAPPLGRPALETASVVVATYRRPEQLSRCLEGLRLQTEPPAEVIVVVHANDDGTARLVDARVREWPELRRVTVERNGSVAAYNCGLRAASGTIVAFVDDDAIPSPSWLAQLLATYASDAQIVAVGGRDLVTAPDGVVDGVRGGIGRRMLGPPEVGRLQWFGRMLGNHHIGEGGPRDTDVLKGVNMSFRRAAVEAHGFDERLWGRGTQIHSELSICLPLRRRGLRLVYDPSIVVVHHPAPRRDSDDRESSAEMVSSAHNEALQILDHFGSVRRLVFFAWALAIGTTHAPGLAVLVRDLLAGRPAAWARFNAANRGRIAALRTRRTERQS
jgi:cellulose synthase/poly-beta-1,6-N-acetylglucosamine synthase-like glycosyltransferase